MRIGRRRPRGRRPRRSDAGPGKERGASLRTETGVLRPDSHRISPLRRPSPAAARSRPVRARPFNRPSGPPRDGLEHAAQQQVADDQDRDQHLATSETGATALRPRSALPTRAPSTEPHTLLPITNAPQAPVSRDQAPRLRRGQGWDAGSHGRGARADGVASLKVSTDSQSQELSESRAAAAMETRMPRSRAWSRRSRFVSGGSCGRWA
jgi:hypothetical protein